MKSIRVGEFIISGGPTPDGVKLYDSNWQGIFASGLAGQRPPMPNKPFARGWNAQYIMEKLRLVGQAERRRLSASPVADWFVPRSLAEIAIEGLACIAGSEMAAWVLSEWAG